MESQTKVNIGMVLVMIVGFTTLIVYDGSGAQRNPTHYCESDQTKSFCFELRDYNGKLDYRCLYDESNKRKYFSCDSGWKEIPTETTRSKSYRCSPYECVPLDII